MGRTLTALVYRDAARRYGAGLVLVLLPMVYLFREWPPWEIRDALSALPWTTRAWVLAAAHALYGLLTAPIIAQLLGSSQLRWWWALPVPARWWRATHLRHLIALDTPWLLAIGYGVTTKAYQGAPVEAFAVGLSFAAITLAGQIALASAADRHPAWPLGWLGAWAMAVAFMVAVPWWAGVLAAGTALVVATARLGQPMPEARTRRTGRAGGHPIIALARMSWLAAVRRSPVAIAWGVAVQIAVVMLAALAVMHVGQVEPEAGRSLQRGVAILCALVGACLWLLADRTINADRPQMDTWGIDPAHERRARLLLAFIGTTPAFVIGTPALMHVGSVGRWWFFDLSIAALWAMLVVVRHSYTLHITRRSNTPQLPRMLLRFAIVATVVVGAGSVLILVPLAIIDAWRLKGLQRRAAHARARFEKQ